MKKKSIVFSSIVLGLAVLTFFMFFMPIIGGSLFDYMRVCLAFLSGSGEQIVVGILCGVFQLLAFIELIIMVAFGIVTLLNVCGVIKSDKLANALRTVNIVFSSLITAAMFITFILLVIGGVFMFGMFFMTLLAIALIVLSAIDKKVAKNSAQNTTVTE